MNTIRPTRFPELGYRCDGRNLWRVYDVTDGSDGRAVGPFYPSKAELLADLNRYAADFGCANSLPPRAVDVQHETAYGSTVRLPFVVRCF